MKGKIATVLTCAALAACNNSNTTEPLLVAATMTPQVTAAPTLTPELPTSELGITGRAIDGYLQGATAFLDLNFNGQLDSNEPSDVTDENGRYNLYLGATLEQCESLAPIVVNVPVGAIDADQGEVTEAYTLIRPQGIANYANLHVTPLTTVFWQIASAKLAEQKIDLSCDSLAQELEQVQSTFEQAVEDVVRHYNVSRESIFADFIASNDRQANEHALVIVKSLQASVQETLALQQKYPDAHVKVSYRRGAYEDGGLGMYPMAWYRYRHVSQDGLTRHKLEKMANDLSKPVRLIIQTDTTTKTVNGAEYRFSTQIESREGDNSPYMCENVLSVNLRLGDKEYGLDNRVEQSEPYETPALCAIADFSEAINERYMFVSDYSDPDNTYRAQFFFKKGVNGFGLLPDVLDLSSKTFELNQEQFVTAFESLPYGFTNTSEANALWWVKTKEYSESDNRISLSVNQRGEWRRNTIQADGTHFEECSDNGEKWGTCPK